MSIARCCVQTSLSESCGQSAVRTKSVDEAPWSVIITILDSANMFRVFLMLASDEQFARDSEDKSTDID